MQETDGFAKGTSLNPGNQNELGDQIILMPCPCTCFPNPFERQLLY